MSESDICVEMPLPLIPLRPSTLGIIATLECYPLAKGVVISYLFMRSKSLDNQLLEPRRKQWSFTAEPLALDWRWTP